MSHPPSGPVCSFAQGLGPTPQLVHSSAVATTTTQDGQDSSEADPAPSGLLPGSEAVGTFIKLVAHLCGKEKKTYESGPDIRTTV